MLLCLKPYPRRRRAAGPRKLHLLFCPKSPLQNHRSRPRRRHPHKKMTQTNSIIYPATPRGVKNQNFSNGDCNSKQRTAKARKNGVQARTARALGIMIFLKRAPRAHGIMTSKGYLGVLLPLLIQWRRSKLVFGHLLVLFLTPGKLGLHYGTVIFSKGTIIFHG